MLVAISAMLAVAVVAVIIDTVNAVILSFCANIRSYPLVLSVIKLKLVSPLLLSRSIWLLVVNKV